MPSKRDFKRWGSLGGRSAYASLTPEQRAEALRERSRRANAARHGSNPPRPRPDYIPDIRNFSEKSLPIPKDAFKFTPSDGEWETIDGDDSE